jgi:glycosyltransferase involved in cell wall biosynthesis
MTGPASSRVAVVGIGLNSYTNPSVLATVRREFPRLEVDWIDLKPLVAQRTHHLHHAVAGAHAIGEFGPGVLLNPRRLRRRGAWTSYLFQLRSRLARERVSQGNYLFSLQIQSMFDASTPNLANFVYTDNTVLANTHYETGGPVPVSKRWLELERQIYHNAKVCFVMSRNVGQSMVEDYGCPPDKVVCAYGGPNALIADVADKTYDQKDILFVGTVWERKGGPELFQAFKLVREQIPDATLTIVGCTPGVEAPGCRIVGRIPPAELAKYYRQASVFCLPTRMEPFGIVFVEAMAHRMPIVATNIAAIPDFVVDGENGALVAPHDIGGLAQALIRLLGNPELCRRMGERSYEISRRYTWENTGEIMRRSIEQIVPAVRGA